MSARRRRHQGPAVIFRNEHSDHPEWMKGIDHPWSWPNDDLIGVRDVTGRPNPMGGDRMIVIHCWARRHGCRYEIVIPLGSLGQYVRELEP